jgi:hypothetical protein
LDVRAKGFVAAIIKQKMTTSLRGFDALKSALKQNKSGLRENINLWSHAHSQL